MAYEASEKHLTELAKLGISDRDLTVLRAACTREGMSADAWGVLVWAAIRLADFERNGKSSIKTERERIDSMRAVEKSAMALRDALQKLSYGDSMSLDRCLFGTDISPAGNTRALSTRSVAVQRISCATAAAARQTLAGFDSEGVTGLGRKQTRSAYAGHIAVLAHQLMPDQLMPGDNGPFRRLCDAVFSVAGVHANAQGSIKYFNSNMRPGMKADGLCL